MTDDPFEGAVCRNHDPDRWFDPHPHEMEAVIHLCNGCSARSRCLQAGISERYGVWGGKTSGARARLRRTQ